jgi:hypothetical protein
MAILFLGWVLHLIFGVWSGAIWPVLIKVLVDFYYYSKIRLFFDLHIPWHWILLSSLMQLAFIPYIGISTLAGRYRWKDRDYHS